MLVEIFDFLYLRILDKLNCDSWRSLDKTINLKSSSIKYEFYEVPEIQNIINRAWNFSHGEYIELYQNTMYIFKLIFETIGIFISLFLINPIVSLICIITIIPAFITNFIKNKIRILNDIKLTNKYTELDYYENVLLKQDGIKDIYINNSFKLFEKKYNDLKQEIFNNEIVIEKKIRRLEITEFLIRIISLCTCILLIGYFTMINLVTYGSLSSSFVLVTTLIYNFTSLIESTSSVLSTMYSIQQFNNLIDIDDSANDETNDINDFEKISFSNVSYRYPCTDKYVIKDMNLEILKGEKIAIVGLNGSGKSTFVKLLLGVLTPSIGEIYVDSTNLKKIDKTNYWHNFSVIFQDFCKYKESLRYNVGISNYIDMNNDSKIMECLEKANFNKEINLDTILSKEFGGIELSGGEWQRISMARAINKQGNIYILDEPNSAIDPLEETRFYQKINDICKEDTCIFVTHRLGSVLFSDLVIFFEDGMIKEIGKHDDLINANKGYAKFWYSQANQYK